MKNFIMSCKKCCFPLNLAHSLRLLRCSSRSKSRKIVLLLVGLDNAGKSSTAKGLAQEPADSVVPTVGFNSVKLKHRGFSVTIYDLGGSSQIRGIWHRYYGDVHGVIFVMDASDVSRIDETRKVLEELLIHDKLAGKPLLLLANKQDRDGALDDLDIVEQLNLEVLVNQHKCPTMVETCSAAGTPVGAKPKLDTGILRGYRWLLRRIISDYESLNSRVEQDCAEQRATVEAARQQWRHKNSQQDLQVEANGNPFKPIHSLVGREQNGHLPQAIEGGDNVRESESEPGSPDSSSHSLGGGGEYIPLHSPPPKVEPDVLIISQPQPLDVVIAVKEQFEWKMHKQKRRKLKILKRTNRTAPVSASSSGEDKVLPPLKSIHSNPCTWTRPSTTQSLPSGGWGLGLSLEQVCPPSESSDSATVVVLQSPRTLASTDSDQDDVVCSTIQ